MSFEETWANASVEGSDNKQAPPEGLYEVALTKARAFVSKKGNEIAALEFRVVGPDQVGYEWTEILMFDSQGRANFAKRTCHLMGVDTANVASLDELGEALSEHEGEYYELEVKQDGDYRNAYVQGSSARQVTRPTPDAEADVAARAAGQADLDSVPF